MYRRNFNTDLQKRTICLKTKSLMEVSMNNKIYIYLILILGLNSIRYISYLLEGSTISYTIIMLFLNVLGLVFCVFSIASSRKRNLHSGK